MLHFLTPCNDSGPMRPPYFVPESYSALLSEAVGGEFFSLSPMDREDLPLRVLCGRACRLLARGMESDELYRRLNITDIPYFEDCFRSYTGLSSGEYRSWALNL